jgi:hypothetical protein
MFSSHEIYTMLPSRIINQSHGIFSSHEIYTRVHSTIINQVVTYFFQMIKVLCSQMVPSLFHVHACEAHEAALFAHKHGT